MGLEMVKTLQVLMACYNGEKYLPQQLASLQRQDDPCFSVLMQDDGSADSTPALLQAVCSDSRFLMARDNGQHHGAIGNFLSLMEQCTADYAALCDQDDLWAADRLSRCRAAMEEAEARYGADTPLLVHSDARLVDAEGNTLHESFFAHQGWDKTAVALPKLLVQNNVTGCTLLMNAALRRLVVQHGDPVRMHMHDWFIALTAAAFGHIIFIDEPLVNYRQHGVNVMGASQQTQVQRGAKALSQWEKGRARIALTYTHTRAFREAYGEALPQEAQRMIDAYLATEQMPKLRRVLAVQKLGCTMQSRVTRLGQMIFG